MQRFTAAFLGEHTLLYRLLTPLHSFISFIEARDPAYFQTKGAFETIFRNDKVDEGTESTADAEEREEERELGKRTMTAIDVVAEELKKLEEEHMSRVARSGKCWVHSFRYETSDYDTDRRQERFKMFNILVQGPLTQFVKRREISSMSELGGKCLKGYVRETVAFLHSPNNNCISSRGGETVLMSSRFLRAATLTITVMERESGGMRSAAIRKSRQSLGQMLISCADCTTIFYEYYDREGKDEVLKMCDHMLLSGKVKIE